MPSSPRAVATSRTSVGRLASHLHRAQVFLAALTRSVTGQSEAGKETVGADFHAAPAPSTREKTDSAAVGPQLPRKNGFVWKEKLALELPAGRGGFSVLRGRTHRPGEAANHPDERKALNSPEAGVQ